MANAMKIVKKTTLKRTIYEKLNYSEKDFKMALSKSKNFYQQDYPEIMFRRFDSNTVDCIQNAYHRKLFFIRNDKLKINLKDGNFIAQLLNSKPMEQ